MRKVGYRATNILDSLVLIKDASELAIDLAFSAILLGDKDLAQEVVDLERTVQDARYEARIALMLAARRADDAERLVGVFNVLDGGVAITAAAADIAQVVLHDIGVPPEIRDVLAEAREITGHAVVSEDSPLRGKTIGELDLERDPGVRIIALRRETSWTRRPGPDHQLLEDDVLVFSGPPAPVEEMHERLLDEPYEPPQPPEPREIESLDEAVDSIIRMKDQAEVAIGLAYTASLFDVRPIAGEVRVLEKRSDELQKELEDWVLGAARSLDDPSSLRGLIHLASAVEVINDAALQIAEVVLRDVDMPAVYAEALDSADEVMTSVEIDPGSDLDGVTIENLVTEEHTGMVVLAVRRGDSWTYAPDPELRLQAEDILYARGPPEGENRLRDGAQA